MKLSFKLLSLLATFLIVPAISFAQEQTPAMPDSIKVIFDKARGGDANAMNEVGGWYYRGQYVDQSYLTALQWWSKAADLGNVRAIGNMGVCYQTGHGIEKDSLKAIQLYQVSISKGNEALLTQQKKYAENGNIFSNMLIGSCYQKGYGMKKDPIGAIPWLTRAAEKGSVTAQRDVALLLLNNKQPAEAAKWFKEAASNNDLTSTFYYGKMLLEGMGVTQDKKEGANYMLKAAEEGFPMAMYYVGNCYMKGDGLTRNAEQAVKWYRQAAGAGQHYAQWDLAQCLREGNGTIVNYDRALFWYAKACAQGHLNAFKNLITDSIPNSPFVSYLNGVKKYYAKDYEGALKDFKVVEKAKIEDGKVMTAAVLLNENYSKKDIKKGVKLLEEAARSNAMAMYLLGGLYEAGKGVDQSMSKAKELFELSSKCGYGPADCMLGDMYFEGRGVNQDYAKAVNYYMTAYKEGQLTENCAKRLAACLEEGKGGVEVNKEEAKKILEGKYNNPLPDFLKKI